jgi:hypothetical protein
MSNNSDEKWSDMTVSDKCEGHICKPCELSVSVLGKYQHQRRRKIPQERRLF